MAQGARDFRGQTRSENAAGRLMVDTPVVRFSVSAPLKIDLQESVAAILEIEGFSSLEASYYDPDVLRHRNR